VALDFVDPDGSGSATLDLARRYLQGPAVDMLLAQENVAETISDADRTHWVLGDHQNTTRDLVDSTGTVQEHRQYDTFGRMISPATPPADFPFAFTGRPLDTDTGQSNRTGLIYAAGWPRTRPSATNRRRKSIRAPDE
jgi:hypothetical protein